MYRYPAKEFNAKGEHVGVGPWLSVIWEVNRLAKESDEEDVFGEPAHTGDWWAGGYVEEYPEARVVIDPEEAELQTVRIVAKTPRVEALLKLADSTVMEGF